jgi:hypothetical protein
MSNQLKSVNWKRIIALPADGKIYHLPDLVTRAVHYPLTSSKCEQVIVETAAGFLRKRFVKGKWQSMEYVSSF